jgi:hypothetical protein
MSTREAAKLIFLSIEAVFEERISVDLQFTTNVIALYSGRS